MATYKEIAQWVKKKRGYIVKTCWIAHCKEIAGLPVKPAPNRHGSGRKVPCPLEKQHAILDAFRYFEMIR